MAAKAKEREGALSPPLGRSNDEDIPDNDQNHKAVVGGGGPISSGSLPEGRMDDRRLLGEDSNPWSRNRRGR